MARDDAANLRPGNVLKAQVVRIDFHVVAQLLGKAHRIRQANVRVINIALGNHVVNKGTGAFEHGAAELLGRHELATRHLNAGLNLEQMSAQERGVRQATARLKEGKVGRNKAQQHAVHDGVRKSKNLIDGGIGASLDVFGSLDGNKRLAYRDKARVHGEHVVAALSCNLGGLMRTGRDFGVRKMQDGRVGLLGMDTVVHMSKIRRRAAAGLGHHAKLVATRIYFERIDRTVLDGLVTNRDMHRHAHDAVALAELRRHIRTRLNHDYVLAHYHHDPSRRWLFITRARPSPN